MGFLMLQLLGDVVPFAVPVAMSPLPIIAAVALLLAPAGTRGGVGFLIGRVVALAVCAFVVALFAVRVGDEPGEAVERGGWLRIAAGVLVMLAAVAIWRMRPRGEAVAELPGWMRTIEKASPAQALMFGALLTVVNLKELAFVVGAGMIVGSAAVPALQALAVSGVFAAVAGAGVAVPVVWSLVAGEGARRPLAAARDWLARNNSIIAAAVMLVIGAMLVGSGIEGLGRE